MQYLADSSDFWQKLIEENNIIPFIAITMGCTIAIVAIVMGGMRSILVGRAREATKREIAAYVAEGSLEADKAVALIEAGRPKDDEAEA